MKLMRNKEELVEETKKYLLDPPGVRVGMAMSAVGAMQRNVQGRPPNSNPWGAQSEFDLSFFFIYKNSF